MDFARHVPNGLSLARLSLVPALAWLTTIATALSAGPYITRAAAAFKKS